MMYEAINAYQRCRSTVEVFETDDIVKSVLNLQMTYIIIAHIYEQWDR